MYVIPPKEVVPFIEVLKIERFFGVGKVMSKKLHRMGIATGADLKKLSKEQLTASLGKMGNYLYDVSRGVDDRPVNPNRIRKSIGAENTFEYDVTTINEVHDYIDQIAKTVYKRVQSAKTSGKTVTVKVKFSDFTQVTRSKTGLSTVKSLEEIQTIAKELIEELREQVFEVRLLGVSISNLDNNKPQKDESFQLTIDF